jgi:uncharacterized MAPEG superfamily protein
MWMPYIINMILVRGLVDAVGYPDDPKPMSDWAIRMKSAHSNAVENLVVFAALVLVAEASGTTNEATALASVIFFWARLVHFASYAFKVPWVRTLAFVTGFGCQLALGWQILM